MGLHFILMNILISLVLCMFYCSISRIMFIKFNIKGWSWKPSFVNCICIWVMNPAWNKNQRSRKQSDLDAPMRVVTMFYIHICIYDMILYILLMRSFKSIYESGLSCMIRKKYNAVNVLPIILNCLLLMLNKHLKFFV